MILKSIGLYIGLLGFRDGSYFKIYISFTEFISKLFMPPGSTDRFLTAPVRAARISRRHSHSVSCQEPARMSPGPLGTSGPPGPPGPSGQSGLSVQLGQSGQSKQNSKFKK